MLPESPRGAPAAAETAATLASSPLAGRYKYRLRFAKGGALRLVSHHDLMHCFERMFRRAALPVARTQGFNPRLRMSFALSLALGVIGHREVLEIELSEDLGAAEVESRLAAQAPPGITIRSAQRLDFHASARVCRARYRLPLQPAPADLEQRCAALLAQAQHWVERARPQPRRLDVRPYVETLAADADGLSMALWITPYGAARPEEIALALGLDQELEGGAVFERTDLELADEGAPPPPELQRAPRGKVKRAHAEPAPQATALLDGPLSFES
jgi:radical SAM-linked protein